ncbi:hypothetical protein ScPMuIL_005588 [Solemya velum]
MWNRVYSAEQPHESLHMRETPDLPWKTVGWDHFTLQGRNYMRNEDDVMAVVRSLPCIVTELLLLAFQLASVALASDVISVEPTTEPYVFIGSNLTLNCTIISDEWTDNSTLRFTRNNNESYPSEYLESFGPNSLQLNYPIQQKDDGGKIYCKAYDNTGAKPWESLAIWVRVEYPPREVENFTCRLFNFDDSMDCNWNLGVEYIKSKKINVTTYCFHP